MKYYSSDVWAARAARNAIGRCSKFLFVEEVKPIFHEEPKYERGAAKRGGNWCAMVVIDHDKSELSKEDLAELKPFDLVFDPQGTPEDREARRERTESGTRVVKVRSSIENPVQVVWDTCIDNPEMTRKEVIQYCVEMGVNPSTAATQYGKWRREQEKPAAE